MCLDVTVTAALKNDVIDRGAEEPGHAVKVTAALKNDVIDRGAEEPGHAANEAHRRKENQVGDSVRAAGMTFRPMAVENLGGWTESAIHKIKKLAMDKAIRHGNEVKKTISAVLQLSPDERKCRNPP